MVLKERAVNLSVKRATQFIVEMKGKRKWT